MELTPKEKAMKLIAKYQLIQRGFYMPESIAKLCVKIAVEEIIKSIDWHDFETPNKEFEFWYEVKQELEKLR